MGQTITADPWLFALAMRGVSQHRVAGQIMRASILTAARTGHVIDLGSDQVRRAIVHSAAWGHVAKTPARCRNCGCIADLSCWYRVAMQPKEALEPLQAAVRKQEKPFIHAYILRCPGEQYAKDLLDIMSLPREGEE